ncbi:MAG: hypothetical protein R6U34_13890, partial [Thioalkalivibrio sp.]
WQGPDRSDLQRAPLADEPDLVPGVGPQVTVGDFRDSHYLRGSPARLLRITLGNLPDAELVVLPERHWEAIVASF